MVARQDLEAALPLGVGAGDQVLDYAEALERAAQLREERRRYAICVPGGLDEAVDRDLVGLHVLRYREKSGDRDNSCK